MSVEIKTPVTDVSDWESLLIHISNDVTAINIKPLINKDIAKMANQKQPENDTQAKYDHKYIKALFRRIKTELERVLAGAAMIEYRIDGKNSSIRCEAAGSNFAHGDINNLTELSALLRDAVGESKLRKLLDDLVSRTDEIDGNNVIHELKQNGVDDMVDNMRADFITKHYDEWSGDYHMDNAWWRHYTEKSLKMAIVIHDVVLEYLRSYPNFDEDEIWSSIDSDDITFLLGFEYNDDISSHMETWADMMSFIKLYAENYG